MSELPALYRALAAQFGTEEAPDPTLSLDDVRRYVASRIAALLDANPGFLMSILYRIDVPEEAVQRAMRETAPESLPDHLAALVVQRQLQKLETRRRHRNDDAS